MDIATANAEQDRFYEERGDKSDRADVTTGNGYSRYDYEQEDTDE